MGALATGQTEDCDCITLHGTNYDTLKGTLYRGESRLANE